MHSVLCSLGSGAWSRALEMVFHTLASPLRQGFLNLWKTEFGMEHCPLASSLTRASRGLWELPLRGAQLLVVQPGESSSSDSAPRAGVKVRI